MRKSFFKPDIFTVFLSRAGSKGQHIDQQWTKDVESHMISPVNLKSWLQSCMPGLQFWQIVLQHSHCGSSQSVPSHFICRPVSYIAWCLDYCPRLPCLYLRLFCSADSTDMNITRANCCGGRIKWNKTILRSCNYPQILEWLWKWICVNNCLASWSLMA